MNRSKSLRLSGEMISTAEKHSVAATQFVFTVKIAEQTVLLFENHSTPPRFRVEDFSFVKQFRCSTSKFGIGQLTGSNCTPLGLHRIAEKIGDGCPVDTIFKARKPIGQLTPGVPDATTITTRIMWLEGLEPGFNQGGNVDTHARYIYIRGTGDETTLGHPASHGCIHLAAEDLVPLFDLLPSGTLVWIEP